MSFCDQEEDHLSGILEVVEAATSSELVSSIVGIEAPKEGLAGTLSSCGNL